MREKLREIAGVFKKLLQKRYRDPQKRNILVKNMDILYLYFPYRICKSCEVCKGPHQHMKAMMRRLRIGLPAALINRHLSPPSTSISLYPSTSISLSLSLLSLSHLLPFLSSTIAQCLPLTHPPLPSSEDKTCETNVNLTIRTNLEIIPNLRNVISLIHVSFLKYQEKNCL